MGLIVDKRPESSGGTSAGNKARRVKKVDLAYKNRESALERKMKER